MEHESRFSSAPFWARATGIILILGLFALSAAHAAVIRQTYEFAQPQLEAVGTFQRVSMEDAWSFGAPGEPVLPLAGVQLLLPAGEELASMVVIPGERVVLDGSYRVEPGQRQYPLSYSGPVAIMEPDPAIYGSRAPFPGRFHDDARTGLFRGYRILSCALHPVEYIPALGTIAYYRSLEVVVTTRPSAPALEETARMVRHDESTLARLAHIVDNPTDTMTYQTIARVQDGGSRLDPAAAYKYIIVTGDGWAADIDPLVAFETERGLKTGVFLKSWILTNYPTGSDEQWRIRDFIIDAYHTWDIDYVLLVGDARDAAGIPDRGLYASGYGTPDSDIPADMYYGCLDGNWNTDGDGYWGEPGEDDLYFELGVGRACVDSEEELANFVIKTMRYQNSPIVSESDEALMVGELLWTDPLTYGDDYKEQVRLGSSANGYTTVGFPGTMNVGTLYDRPGTWQKSTLISLMENGLNIVNHLGHCNVTYSMRMDNPDIESFDNDGTVHSYNFVYSQGCYCGSMDNRNDGGGYTDDCFAEEFQTDDDGAVAVVMNSRYGWGDPGGTNGSSQFFDREFFDAIFAEHIYPVSYVNDDSRMDVVWSIDYGANRWCYYELNLFGDPAMHLWTATPRQLDVDLPDVALIGVPEFEVSVHAFGSGAVAGARVTAYTEDYTVYATGVTNLMGQATLLIDTEEPGTLYVTVTAHDFLTFHGSTPIIPPAGPYLVVGDKVIDDDALGESNGNGDAGCDAGEAIELHLGLRNVGIEAATNVRATLSTSDPYAVIGDAYETYGDIAPEQQGFCQDDFEIAIQPGCPDGYAIQFSVMIESDNRMVWNKQFSLAVEAPVMTLADFIVDDEAGGNNNGRLDPGEYVELLPVLANTGSEDATGLTLQLHVSSQYVEILESGATIDLLPAGGQASPETSFRAHVLSDCPEPEILQASVVVSGDWGQQATLNFSLPVGGFWDTMESGPGAWIHYVVTASFSDQWHLSTQRNYTPGGTSSWKFGDSGAGDYANLADGALETEPLALREECYLRFRHWMEAEVSQAHAGYCYDGGMVEMSVNGGAWQQITPVGGYPYKIRAGGTPGPWPAETEVYSGNIDWAEAVFAVSDLAGEVRFRFRFGSDGADAMEGWYIDDVEWSGTSQGSQDAGEWTPVALRPAVEQNRPNPFGSETTIVYRLPARGDVELRIFDPSGRLVRTLVNGPADPGTHRVTWDGCDQRGVALGSGIYFYHLVSDGVMQTRKLILTR